MSEVLEAQLARAQSSELSHFGDDPIALFQTWLQEAIDSGLKEPRAMSLGDA
jgi:pyridoxine/pyridoxamine 5'-phosphate oxidase